MPTRKSMGDMNSRTPTMPATETKAPGTMSTGFGMTMSDAKRNMNMGCIPWVPDSDRPASTGATNKMGSMADDMGMTREKMLKPKMPAPQPKAPGAI